MQRISQLVLSATFESRILLNHLLSPPSEDLHDAPALAADGAGGFRMSTTSPAALACRAF